MATFFGVLAVGTFFCFYIAGVFAVVPRIQEYCFQNSLPEVLITWVFSMFMLMVLPAAIICAINNG